MRRAGTPAGNGATTSESYTLVYPAFTGANVFVSATQLTARAVPPPEDIYGICAGTNDRYLPDVVVENIIRWFNAYAGRRRFVITPLCQSDEPLGSYLGESTRQIAARLGEACGVYAIDMMSALLANGLRSQGMEPNGDDFTAIFAGVLPSRLRSDALHLNDAGYDAAAQIVVCNFIQWGWVTPAQIANVPPLWAML